MIPSPHLPDKVCGKKYAFSRKCGALLPVPQQSGRLSTFYQPFDRIRQDLPPGSCIISLVPQTPYLVFQTERKLYMKDISKEYLLLFNIITDAGEALRQLQANLMAAQQQAEALFLEETDPTDASKSA
jgi:hypothetical protein